MATWLMLDGNEMINLDHYSRVVAVDGRIHDNFRATDPNRPWLVVAVWRDGGARILSSHYHADAARNELAYMMRIAGATLVQYDGGPTP